MAKCYGVKDAYYRAVRWIDILALRMRMMGLFSRYAFFEPTL
jgi:hypothetical protein